MASADDAQKGIGVRNLLEAGLHFGHQTKRWNPKMKRYIFDKRNGIHIVDLAKSLVHLKQALGFLNSVVTSGKDILFVGTKKQAQQIIKDVSVATEQHYVTHRWLGGTLTNSTTIRASIGRMRQLEALEKNNSLASMHKKEAARLRRELEKLRRNLSGIADMVDLPGALFVVDINREAIAVAEANRLNIPVVAIVDTNCDPDPIDYVIPGNDDAIRAIKLIVEAITETVRKGRAEYAKVAAEIARKKEAEEAARKKAEKERQAKAAEAAKAAKAAKTAEEKPAKQEADANAASEPAEKKEGKSEKAAPRKRSDVKKAPRSRAKKAASAPADEKAAAKPKEEPEQEASPPKETPAKKTSSKSSTEKPKKKESAESDEKDTSEEK